MDNDQKKPDFSELLKNYPGGFIARMEIGRATGGALSREYMCNLDTDKDRVGIKGRFRVGRKVCYPVKEVIAFLEKQAQVVDD